MERLLPPPPPPPAEFLSKIIELTPNRLGMPRLGMVYIAQHIYFLGPESAYSSYLVLSDLSTL